MFGLSYFKLAGIAAIAVLIGWHFFGDWKTGHDLRAAQLLATQLQANLTIQNEAIAKLKADADDRLKKAADELAAARSEADGLRGKAKIIYKQGPSTPGNSCKSALDLLNGAK